MKDLISINNKFMEISPKRLIELINNSKYTKGIELYINIDKENELIYLDNLVKELKQSNLILQIHGEIYLDINKNIEYIKLLEKYSDYLNYPIVYTIHSINDIDKDISKEKTNNYIKELINNINTNKIIICLENLNIYNGEKRLTKEDIKNIIIDNNIYLTYDIGHEIIDYKKTLPIDKELIDRIRNVHIHSYKDNIDHIPIYENDININEIIRTISILKNNNYKYNIVYEYGLEYCNGLTKEEKIKDYLYSIDLVSGKIK